MTRRLALVLLVATLAGCAQRPPAQTGNGLLLRAILPPESLGKEMSLSQEVTAEFQEQRQAFRVEIELTPTRMAMVGLTPMGVPLFTLVQENDEVVVDSLGAESLPFDPRHILSDFQIAFWPLPVLRQAFEPLGLRLETAAEGRTRRVVGRDGDDLVEVVYLDEDPGTGDVVLQHFDYPYRLSIKSSKATES